VHAAHRLQVLLPFLPGIPSPGCHQPPSHAFLTSATSAAAAPAAATFVQVHVAEQLQVPLHILSTIPWLP
jgi:hypothetical protein